MTQDISKYASRTVGEIVADNFAAADVFHHFGVDFCCHGADNYLEAVGKANADPERVQLHSTTCRRSREPRLILSNGRRIC